MRNIQGECKKVRNAILSKKDYLNELRNTTAVLRASVEELILLRDDDADVYDLALLRTIDYLKARLVAYESGQADDAG